MVCLFCNEAGMPWLEQDGWKSRLCPGCGLVFLSPRPTEDEIAAIYERGTSHTSPEHHLARRGSWVTRYQARRTVRMLRHRCPPPARLIEIGPGDGSVLVAAREAGYDVAGVELNPIQAAAIRDGDNIACVETLDKIGELGRFDPGLPPRRPQSSP